MNESSTESDEIKVRLILPSTENSAHKPIVIKANDTKSTGEKMNTCDNEKNPLVYQFAFAFNIAFKSFCSLVANIFNDLFRRKVIDEWDIKQVAKVFIASIVIILVFGVIVMAVYLMCRFLFRMTRKRKLLLDELSEQRNKKDFTSVVIDKKYDSAYYNMAHNRNIYVSNPQLVKKIDTEKYKSIPKEYFY